MAARGYKGGGGSGGGGGANEIADSSPADRWNEAIRKFELGQKRKLELERIVRGIPWEIYSSNEGERKNFEDALIEMKEFPEFDYGKSREENHEDWTNEFMSHNIGDHVVDSKRRYSMIIKEKIRDGSKWRYVVQLDGIIVFSPEVFKIFCENGVDNFKDTFETRHYELRYRAEEEGDNDKLAAWSSILKGMLEEAFTDEKKALAEIAKA